MSPAALTGISDPEVLKYARRYYRGMTILVCLLMLLVGVGLYLNYAQGQRIQQLQEDGAKARHILLKQADRLIDCTTPGGQCYEQGQKRTNKAIQVLTKAIAADNDRQTQEILAQLQP